jgi:hypothetical protein
MATFSESISRFLQRFGGGVDLTGERTSTLDRYFSSSRAADPYADIEVYDPEEAARQRRAAVANRTSQADGDWYA